MLKEILQNNEEPEATLCPIESGNKWGCLSFYFRWLKLRRKNKMSVKCSQDLVLSLLKSTDSDRFHLSVIRF